MTKELDEKDRLYVVTGATGRTGNVVAETLLAYGKRVRVIGRNPNKLQRFVRLGADPFIAEPMDARAMRRAFADAAVAYVMLQPNYIADSDDFLAFQKALVESIVPALARSRASHAVALSSWGADKDSGTGPVLGLRKLEQWLNDLSKVNVLHLRADWFMENTIPMIHALAASQEARGAIRGDLPLPMVSTGDVGMAAARAMLELDFHGKVVREIQGQRDLSLKEALQIIGSALPWPVAAYLQEESAAARRSMLAAGISEHVANLMLEVADALNTGYVHMLEPRSAANSTSTSYEMFVDQVLRNSAQFPVSPAHPMMRNTRIQ